MRDLVGMTVAITGGSGDIGRAIAGELRNRGARAVQFDLHAAADVVERLHDVDLDRDYRQVDVTDQEAVTQALHDLDDLDVVVGNAGIVESAPFLELTPESWRRHLDVNLTGCFFVGQAAARLMVQRNRPGLILFTGSWVQDVPWPEISAYCTSKAGLKMLARSMARELAQFGIRVNVIAPGIVNAGLAGRQLDTDPAYAARAGSVIPLGELGSAEQVAHAVAFLCSTDARYMTGSVLLVDGGCSLFQFDR